MSLQTSQRSGDHPSDEDLMRFLDGELSSIKTATIDSHVSSCEACKSKLQSFSETASRFSRESLFPALQSIPLQDPAPFRFLLAPGPPRTLPRTLWNGQVAASVAVLLLAALVGRLVLSPPPVSARDLVNHARRQQGSMLQQISSKAILRQMRVVKTIEGRGVASQEHWDSTLEPGSTHERLDARSEIAGEIAAGLPSEGCQEFVPLSLDMLECLLDTNELSVAVRESASRAEHEAYEIQVTSSSVSSGAFFDAAWTLDPGDWRPTQVVYRIGTSDGLATYQIEEEAYSFVPSGPLESTLSELKNVDHQSVSGTTVLPALPSLTRSSAAVLRLRAYEILSKIELTPEDDIRVVTTGDGGIRIAGIVATEARKTALSSLIAEAQGVEVAVLTVAEAVAQAASLSLSAATDAGKFSADNVSFSASAETVRSEGPLLAERMEAAFGADDAGRALATEFSNRLLDETQQMIFDAQWLNRLRKSMPEPDWNNLAPEDQDRFVALDAELTHRLVARHQNLRAVVSGVLCPASCADQAGRGVPPETAMSTEIITSPWLSALEAELKLLKTMFVDRGLDPSVSVADAPARWFTATAKVDADLQVAPARPSGAGVSASAARAIRLPQPSPAN